MWFSEKLIIATHSWVLLYNPNRPPRINFNLWSQIQIYTWESGEVRWSVGEMLKNLWYFISTKLCKSLTFKKYVWSQSYHIVQSRGTSGKHNHYPWTMNSEMLSKLGLGYLQEVGEEELCIESPKAKSLTGLRTYLQWKYQIFWRKT